MIELILKVNDSIHKIDIKTAFWKPEERMTGEWSMKGLECLANNF